MDDRSTIESPDEEYQDTNIRRPVPPGDPFVRQSLITNEPIIRRKREASRKDFSESKSAKRLTRHRRRMNLWLGTAFAFLAFIVFTVSRIFAPKIVVNLDQNTYGNVWVDGKEAGRTGASLGPFTLGSHTIRVRPDDSTLTTDPESLVVKLGYGMLAYEYALTVVPQESAGEKSNPAPRPTVP